MDASKLSAKSAAQSMVAAKKTEAVDNQQRQDQRKVANQAQAAQQQAQSRPVFNTQGQRIGGRLNVTA